MKVFAVALIVAVAAVAVLALTDEQKEKIKQHHAACLPESKVDPELITKARQGTFTDDAALKEHLNCLFKKIGFQNDKGELQKDVLKTKLGPEIKDDKKTDELIAKCAIQKDSPQETAFNAIKCFHENTPTHIDLV